MRREQCWRDATRDREYQAGRHRAVARCERRAGGWRSYFWGSVPDEPTCRADDNLSGVVAGGCTVSGYSSAVGHHTVTVSVEDDACNITSVSRSYDVKAWTVKGFYAPVDMGGVYNTVKGGSTVPLKFEIFCGTTELTTTAAMAELQDPEGHLLGHRTIGRGGDHQHRRYVAAIRQHRRSVHPELEDADRCRGLLLGHDDRRRRLVHHCVLQVEVAV